MPLASLPAYVKASAAWHGAMAVGAVAVPAALPWWVGGLAANHLLITGASMVPRSQLIGPNVSRLPGSPDNAQHVALTFDDGPDPDVTVPVLNMLRAANMHATFFCIGERLARYPDLGRKIVREGHRIENHTQTHSHRFAFRGPRGLRKEITDAQRTVHAAVGRAPLYFRAPAGMRNPFLQPVLAQLGLQLVSWTRRGFDTRNTSATSVLGHLTRKLSGGDILLLHDGHAARTADGTPMVLRVLPPLLDRIVAAGLSSKPLDHLLPETPR